MTADAALRACLKKYIAAVRQAEADGDEVGIEVFTRRRNQLAGLIGYRTRQARLEMDERMLAGEYRD